MKNIKEFLILLFFALLLTVGLVALLIDIWKLIEGDFTPVDLLLMWWTVLSIFASICYFFIKFNKLKVRRYNNKNAFKYGLEACKMRLNEWHYKRIKDYTIEDILLANDDGFSIICADGKIKEIRKEE
jgi:hypothetical protein